MSEQGLTGLVSEWRDRANRPRIRVSDAKKDALIAERTEGVNDAQRLCADELAPFLERLEALEQQWRDTGERAVELDKFKFVSTVATGETLVHCADKLRSILHGEQQGGETRR